MNYIIYRREAFIAVKCVKGREVRFPISNPYQGARSSVTDGSLADD